ncbi:hypothetical protein ACSV5S_20785 [Agrobacterium deltaense]|uniref:hypothetical protein n=1 Tax=Agrobacterium deltaense TaxID=1183412 RepID=UPI003FD1CD80
MSAGTGFAGDSIVAFNCSNFTVSQTTGIGVKSPLSFKSATIAASIISQTVNANNQHDVPKCASTLYLAQNATVDYLNNG